jgi:hypothetical protein
MKKSITSLNGNIFSSLFGFGMMVDFNTSYYAADSGANKIYMLNDNFDYVKMAAFSAPAYIVTVNSSLYITGTSNIWKADKYLNILITYNESAAYRDIYYNATQNLIYVAPRAHTYFQVFNLNLTLNYTVNVSPNSPRSFTEYKNELYVGTTNGLVLVVVNKMVIRSFTGCSGGIALSACVTDNSGLMTISCIFADLYYSNSTFANKSLAISSPSYVGFDSKSRFVLLSGNQIVIFYC